MNLLGTLRSQLPLSAVVAIGLASGLMAGAVLVRALDGAAFAEATGQAASDPVGVGLALGAFGLAFVLRARAWQRVLPALTFGQALAGIHLALGANHVLPFRLGEPARVLSVVRRTSTGLEAAAASTVTLRAADMLAVVAIGLVAAPTAFLGLVGWVTLVLFGFLGCVAVFGWRWLRAVAAQRSDVAMPGPAAMALTAAAWPLEAVLVWQVAHWAGLDLTWSEALVVTTVAVAAQVAAIAPGGFGTYEAAAVAAYVALGHDAETALVAALATHALKTVYSLVAGGVAAFAPAPSLVGRLRLRRGTITSRTADAERPDGPIVLFMPAHNEEASVGACIRRTPETVAGHRVDVLVIDDGSTDATVERARDAGAEVITLPHNRGLGAAVRRGLAEGVDRHAAAVVFCDADGEYPPEELERLVTPILDGNADYVTGSRFLGRIDHMRPHRRVGNIVLTRLLSIVARRRITDGQTGYRALSPDAAASAEIIHDFNYAQVLTLDLLAKGFRHSEVPISYHFRTTGESFIKLGPYLRRVIPAVYREVNAA